MAGGGDPSVGEVLDEVEAELVGKILKKGRQNLTLEEARQVHRSKTFEDEWHKQTGSAMPEHIRTQITDRVNRSAAPDPSKVPSDPEAQNAAFLRSVSAGEVEAVRTMLESKGRRQYRVAMSVVDDQMRCCTHLAAKQGHVQILQLLHDHGAEMEAKDKFGRTPMHLACELGRVKSVETLLRYGCRPEQEDKRGRNGLHLAACCEDPEVCRLLIARRPTLVGSADSHRRTSLFFAVLNVHVQAAAEVTQLLLQGQALVNARDAYGMTPLHYAAEENRKPAVMLLLRHRADAALEDTVNHRTPLQLTTNEAIRKELRRSLGAGEGALGGGSAASAGGAAPAPRPAGANGAQARSQSAGRLGGGVGVSDRGGGGGDGGGQAVLKAPIALGVPFEQLQERFVRIMSRVQEGGIQQLEHVKSPHLFTGSWMVDVSSHQQLLGQAGVLKFVPGPEVAIRVFNLLRPPSHFPISRGDERDIIGYFQGADGLRDGSARPWEGDDPYRPAAISPEEELSHARKSELLREIHNQRQEIESKAATIGELQKKVEQQQTLLEASVTPEQLQMLKDNKEKAERLCKDKDEELSKLGSQCRVLEGKKRVIEEQLQLEQTKNADLATEHMKVQQKYHAELETRGEQESYKSVLDHEREKHAAMQQNLKLRLQDLERDLALEKAAKKELSNQLKSSVDREASEQELAELRIKEAHQLNQLNTLRSDLAQAKQKERDAALSADAEAEKRKTAENERNKALVELEAAKQEIIKVRTLAERETKELKTKELEVAQLREELAASQYPHVLSVFGIGDGPS